MNQCKQFPAYFIALYRPVYSLFQSNPLVWSRRGKIEKNECETQETPVPLGISLGAFFLAHSYRFPFSVTGNLEQSIK